MTSQPSTIETVIPDGTVILRESEVQSLDEAVRRVREDASTRHARILIVDSDHPLEGEVRPVLDPPTPKAGQAPSFEESFASSEGARRLEAQLACLERFVAEADQVFAHSAASPAEALGSLQEIHQWSMAVIEEIGNELARLRRGEARVGLRAALRAGTASTADGSDAGYRVWARPTQLHELFELAHWLVAKRSDGAVVTTTVEREAGARSVDVVFTADGPALPVCDAGQRIARLRELVQELEGRLPAPSRTERPELRIRLPLAD